MILCLDDAPFVLRGFFNVTLLARREPTFHAGGPVVDHEIPQSSAAASHPQAAGRASGLTRLMSTLQIASSLLAVPLGLASGYSIYRANFSVETTCQSLRSSIISMLDKNVDAATRRMLVRRDVAAFEASCGGVDPDAHAAFKTLLAGGTKAVTTAAAPPVAAARKPEAKSEVKSEAKVEIKTESKLSKLDFKPELKAAPETAQPDASLSDARWLAAVRQALVTHGPDQADAIEQARQATVKPLRAEAPVMIKQPALVSPPSALQSSWIAQPPAPTVPQPAYAEPAPQVNADHPVPPAPIPTLAATGFATPVNAEERSDTRIGGWIAQIPLIGRMIEPRRN
jgi:hypothetical protein